MRIFDDEVDSLGFFDVATQRRTENCREALLLPAGEVLPLWRDGAAEETAERLETLAGRMKDKPVARQLRSDADLLRQGIVPNGSDRFLAAVYPELVTAMDYLPAGCLVCVSESGRTAEALKGWLGQLKADVTAAMDSGILCGPMAEAALPETEFARQLERFPVCQLESLPTSRYLLAPKALRRSMPAAVRLRRIAGDGGDGPDPLSHRRLPGGGAVRRTGAGQKSAGAAGGPEDPGGAGSGGGALPGAERGAHYAGYSVRRVRVPGPAAGGADVGPADHAAGRQVQKDPPQAGQQSAEAPVLR
ncbi:MAG: hypothetical protein ACLUIX_04255 [Oscillospiraceae bacterium]